MIIKDLKRKDLTSSERILADYIISHLDEVLHMTSRELADVVYVSAPTVTRLCKKLGFENYSEFKVSLSKEANTIEKRNYHINHNIPFTKEDTTIQLAEKICDLSVFSVISAKDNLNYDIIEKACEILHKQENIDIYGTGLAAISAKNFSYKLNRLGYHAEILEEYALQNERSLNTRKDRVSIIISYSGMTPSMLRICKKVKEKDGKVILITGNPYSEMVKYADFPIIIDSEENLRFEEKTDYFASIYMLYYLFEMIFCIIFKMDYAPNMEKMKESAKRQFE